MKSPTGNTAKIKKITETAGRAVFTVGHSNLSIQQFIATLQKYHITAIADVRSAPFSRRMAHFNKDELRTTLRKNNISYVFLGKELGGRPHDANLYHEGVADYEKMALEPIFLEGIDRVAMGSKEHNIALMCSEHNPLDCHRCLLVGRALSERQIPLQHILSNGRVAKQIEIEDRLLEAIGGADRDMFSSRADRLSQAYRERAKNVAYRLERSGSADLKVFDRYKHVS